MSNVKIYELLEKHPGLSVELQFDSSTACYLLKLTYGPYSSMCLVAPYILKDSEYAISRITQVFFSESGIELKK